MVISPLSFLPSLRCRLQRPVPSTTAAATGRVKTQLRGCVAAALWDSPSSLMEKHAKVSKEKIVCEYTCVWLMWVERVSLHGSHDCFLSDPQPNSGLTIRFTSICTKLRSWSFALLLLVVGFAVEHFSPSGSRAMTSMTVVRGEDAAAWALTIQTHYYSLLTFL